LFVGYRFIITYETKENGVNYVAYRDEQDMAHNIYFVIEKKPVWLVLSEIRYNYHSKETWIDGKTLHQDYLEETIQKIQEGLKE
jgi:hypothetical protein